MPRNQDGEYELVLGTPQLLSVVFLLVVLLGVVFSAGYYLGRSTTGGLPGLSDEAEKRATAASGERPKAAGEPSGQGVAAEAPLPAEQPLEPGEVKLAPGGAAGTVTAPATTAIPEAKADPGQPVPTPTAAAAEAAYPDPAPGQTFVQVAAVRRAEAEFLADVLKRKGFPALVAPGPSETLFRVLVGPLKDEDEIARTRRRLEDAGFRSSYVRKY